MKKLLLVLAIVMFAAPAIGGDFLTIPELCYGRITEINK